MPAMSPPKSNAAMLAPNETPLRGDSAARSTAAFEIRTPTNDAAMLNRHLEISVTVCLRKASWTFTANSLIFRLPQIRGSEKEPP